MKPTELYSQWVVFASMVSDPFFTVEQRIGMAEEALASLPPEMLCTQTKLSRDAVAVAMKGRLDDLRNEQQRNPGTGLHRSGSGRDQEEATNASAPGDDPGPNEGCGVSLENLVDPQKSPKKKKAKG